MDDRRLSAANAALREGRWRAAKEIFEELLRDRDTAAARDGLGQALWWLDEVDAGIAQRERAYVLFRSEGKSREAARAAAWIAREHMTARADSAVAQGWLARARRLLDGVPDCSEEGWIELVEAKLTSHPADALHHASRALEIARAHDERDLEAVALSEVGMLTVILGRVEEGMLQLDEAAAAATGGEVSDLLAVGDTCCNVVLACEAVSDFERGGAWCREVEEFSQRTGCMPIQAFCRSVYGGMLMATGRWTDADLQFRMAAEEARRGHPPIAVHATARLAQLRARQGRLEEAELLLSGLGGLGVAAAAMAELELSRGRRSEAASLISRHLDRAGDSLAAVPLLTLLAEAAPSSDAAERLRALADKAGVRALTAIADMAEAQRLPAPIELLESAASGFAEVGMVYDAARAHLALADALRLENPRLAIIEAEAALRLADGLGATPLADRAAALLRLLGRTRTGPRRKAVLTRREQDVLRLLGGGLNNPEIGARLHISQRTAEHHVGSILSKLGLRSRSEAAAYAATHLAGGGEIG